MQLPLQPQVRQMLAVDGFYIAADTNEPGYEVPLVVISGQVFCMQIDFELLPERFLSTLTLNGPFRAQENASCLARVPELSESSRS